MLPSNLHEPEDLSCFFGQQVDGQQALQRLLTARTLGDRRTSPMKLASKGEVLSLRHARASRRVTLKSTTGKMTTVAGHRQRAVARTHPTPKPVDTRLRIVASFSPSWTMRGDFGPFRDNMLPSSGRKMRDLPTAETRQTLHPPDPAGEVSSAWQKDVSSARRVRRAGQRRQVDPIPDPLLA